MRFLVDTNVISEGRKVRANSNVLAFFKNTPKSNLYISYLTIGEIKKGIALKRNKDFVASCNLDKWLHILIERYNDKLIGINTEICKCWGELLAINGTNHIDALIAAQAIVHDMSLVTRNTKHFLQYNVKLINPFE